MQARPIANNVITAVLFCILIWPAMVVIPIVYFIALVGAVIWPLLWVFEKVKLFKRISDPSADPESVFNERNQ